MVHCGIKKILKQDNAVTNFNVHKYKDQIAYRAKMDYDYVSFYFLYNYNNNILKVLNLYFKNIIFRKLENINDK